MMKRIAALALVAGLLAIFGGTPRAMADRGVSAVGLTSLSALDEATVDEQSADSVSTVADEGEDLDQIDEDIADVGQDELADVNASEDLQVDEDVQGPDEPESDAETSLD